MKQRISLVVCRYCEAHWYIPDSLASAPDLKVPDLLHLRLILLPVVWGAVVVQASLGLSAIGNLVVQLVEDWLQGILELGAPVDGTSTGGRRASSVHVVHAVRADEWVQALGGLLNGLVEGLRWAVAALAQDLVLSEEHAVNTAHKAATLAVQIGVDLLLEGCLVEVARADSNTHGNGLLKGLASDVLIDSHGRVDTTTLTEEGADSAAGALWRNKDDINVLWNIDLGQVLEDWREAVREVEGLALGELRLDVWPSLGLGGIREQVHDDGALANGLVDLEEVLAWHPAVLDGLLPRCTILANTDDDVQAVVAEVEALAVALGAVADEGEGVVLEVVLQVGISVYYHSGINGPSIDSHEASLLASPHALLTSVSIRPATSVITPFHAP